MATTIKFGHASSPSRGVLVENSSYPVNLQATVLLRPKDLIIAEKSALICEAVCNNDNVGYSQDYRGTLKTEAEKVNYDISKITTKCYTDCSAFMSFCATVAGANIDYSYGTPNCGSMKSCFTRYGDYEAETSSVYLTSLDNLKRGDILVRETYSNGSRHTIMILGNGEAIPYAPPIDINTTGTTSKPIENILKISVDINSLTNSNASILTKIVKMETGEEKEVDSAYINLYDWSYNLEYIGVSGKKPLTDKLELKANSFELPLSGLTPNTSYLLKVLATESNGTAKFSSPSIVFTTPPKDTQSKKDSYKFTSTYNYNKNLFKLVNKAYLKVNNNFKSIALHDNT